ncbi:Perilipin-4 [Frankliniella fusca]|uniref:Perilipin-4 n=1 Tax=Frankliniella fusca TaxID=407009 RepID=A0AAE1GRE4_9NEOP|nr:Perilipin-4 [Frankliniella fusca]
MEPCTPAAVLLLALVLTHATGRRTPWRALQDSMEPCTPAAVLLLALVLTHATGLHAGAAPEEEAKKIFCKEVCQEINGLDTFFDGECFCVLSHAPTPIEAPAMDRAMQRAKERGMPIITSVVGDNEGGRGERCLLGVTSALRARASRVRQSALREPVVVEQPALPAGISIGQVAVPLAVPVQDARASASGSASGAPAPAGTVPVSVLTVAGPLPDGREEAAAGAGTRLGLGRPRARSRARERAQARALLGSQAAGGLLAAASESAPRYALSDIVVAPVQTVGAPFLDSSTAAFSSMAGAVGMPFRGQQQFDGPLGPYQPEVQPEQQQGTVIFNEFPSAYLDGGEFLRSAAQRAADSGAQAAHAAVSQATDFASAATGAGLDAAKGVVDSGRWAASTGLSLADDALKQADRLSSAALRAQLRAADQTVSFMVPPQPQPASADVQTQTAQQPREAALRFPPALSLNIMNPGVYYPDVRASDGGLALQASAPQISVLSQRSVRAEPRGVLTDAAGAVENAFHSVASGVQSGAHKVADVVQGVAHDVSSGVHTGVHTASNVAQDTVHGVAQGVQAGANTAAETVHGVAHGVVDGVQSGVSTASGLAQDAYQGVASGVQSGVSTASGLAQDAYQGVASGVQTGASTLSGLASGALNAAHGFAQGAGHGLQHAAHQIGSLGHAAEDDVKHMMDKARAASALDPLQTAASQAMQAVQAVQGAAGSARDFVTSTANQGVNVAQGAQAAAVRQVHDAADKVQGAVQDVAGQVRGSVQDVAGQGAQAVRGISDAVRGTVVSTAGEVRGQVQDLQQAVKSSVLDAQNAARDAILAAASQGTSKSQQMSQGALDAAQAAVTAAIDKVRKAMNLASATGGASARSVGGVLRSAYQTLQPSSYGVSRTSDPALGIGPTFSVTPTTAVAGLGFGPYGQSSLSWRNRKLTCRGLARTSRTMARPLPLLAVLLLPLLLHSARCRIVNVEASAAEPSPGATATTTERVVVVTAQTVDRKKSRSHWPHTAPVTALHAFSSSAAGDGWTAVAGVTKRDLKQEDAPWQQRLKGEAEDENAAVLHWKSAEDEKVLRKQEQRVRDTERFVVGGALPLPLPGDDQSNDVVDYGAKGGGQSTSRVEEEEEGDGGESEQPPAPPPSPAPAPARQVDPNTRVRTLLAELQQVMQKYLRRSHREDRRHEDADDNGLRPALQHSSAAWWPRPEELMRASLRVLVACRRGLEQEEDVQAQDPQDLLARLRECLRGRLLAAVDNLVAAETVPIAFGLSLVRRPELRAGRVGRDSQDGQEVSHQEQQGQQALAPRLLSRMADLFATHDLRIGDGAAVEEGRRRHQYRKVFPVLVTGFMILISLMVPLGFQFMAMIGGKALLMSKMALIMASMYNFRSGGLSFPSGSPLLLNA